MSRESWYYSSVRTRWTRCQKSFSLIGIGKKAWRRTPILLSTEKDMVPRDLFRGILRLIDGLRRPSLAVG